MVNTLHPTPPPISQDAIADLLCTVVVLCRGKLENERDFWAYLLIKPSMAAMFKDARKRGIFDLEEYGTIIEHGEGKEIPEEIYARMEKAYGFKANDESKLSQLISDVGKKYSF